MILILAGKWLAEWLDDRQDLIGWVIAGIVALAVAGYLWRLLTWKPRAERPD